MDRLSICMTVKDRSRIELEDGRILTPFPDCIAALVQAAQELRGEVIMEVVVSDWGSRDDPLDRWLDGASEDLDVMLLQIQRRGFSRGCGLNLSAVAARYDNLFFLDADVLVSADLIRQGLEALEKGAAFFPVCRYYATPEQATWSDRGYGNCMLSRAMVRRVGLWPVFYEADSEDVLFHDGVQKYYSIVRNRVSDFVHPWHPTNRPQMWINNLFARGDLTAEQYAAAFACRKENAEGCPTRALIELGFVSSRDWLEQYSVWTAHRPPQTVLPRSDVVACHFAFVADVPGWALHRAASGIAGHHDSVHTWSVFCEADLPEDWGDVDIVRVGCVPLAATLLARGLLQDRKVVVSVASYRDIRGGLWCDRLRRHLDQIVAFAVLDRRLFSHVVEFGKPILYMPDRCDFSLFRPIAEVRPREGPLRIGWTGSEEKWGNLKHVSELEEACAKAGAVFVRQCRERDGALSQEDLLHWYNSLDVYVAANDVETLTPVPTLEAAACGVAIGTTRCGELWPLLSAHNPQAVIQEPTVDSIAQTLQALAAQGREHLHLSGLAFREAYRFFLDWDQEAARVTEDMAALVRGE